MFAKCLPSWPPSPEIRTARANFTDLLLSDFSLIGHRRPLVAQPIPLKTGPKTVIRHQKMRTIQDLCYWKARTHTFAAKLLATVVVPYSDFPASKDVRMEWIAGVGLTQVRSRISPRFGELCTPVLGASKAPYVHSSNNGDGAKPSGRTSQLLCSTSAEKTTKVQTVAKELKCPVGTESLPSKQRF